VSSLSYRRTREHSFGTGPGQGRLMDAAYGVTIRSISSATRYLVTACRTCSGVTAA
jgi:hypothetical protein